MRTQAKYFSFGLALTSALLGLQPGLGLAAPSLVSSRGTAAIYAENGAYKVDISYHASLNDAYGDPLNGMVNVAFTIFDMKTGGASLWTEERRLQVRDGAFSVRIRPLDHSLLAGSERWLQVTIDGGDPKPRRRLAHLGLAHVRCSCPPLEPPYRCADGTPVVVTHSLNSCPNADKIAKRLITDLFADNVLITNPFVEF